MIKTDASNKELNNLLYLFTILSRDANFSTLYKDSLYFYNLSSVEIKQKLSVDFFSTSSKILDVRFQFKF